MSAVRFGRVGWAIPSPPKRVNKPSWMGIPASSTDDPPSSALSMPSSTNPSIPPAPSMPRPVSMPPPSSRRFAPKLASIPPAIATMREVELEAELNQLRDQTAMLVERLASARSHVFAEMEQEIVKLSLTIASRIVGREVVSDPMAVLGWIREGMTMLPGEDVTVAVAPDIASHLAPEELSTALPKIRRVVVDAALKPGAVEVREAGSVVEVGADARLAAIADALGADGAR